MCFFNTFTILLPAILSLNINDSPVISVDYWIILSIISFVSNYICFWKLGYFAQILSTKAYLIKDSNAAKISMLGF